MSHKKILTQGYVVYPDSMPENFFSDLEKFLGSSTGFSYILHDKDVDKEGNPKKPHYHILFQSMLSRAQWNFVHALGGVKHHEDLFSPSGSEKYLTHEDNQDKYHYSLDDVIRINWDADVWERLIDKEKEIEANKANPDEEAENVSKIVTAIMENDLKNIQELTKYVMSNMSNAELMIVVKRAYFFSSFMKG